jgi:Trk K+ transport system NAD-binding subunit
MAGKTIRELPFRRSGCSVLAIARDAAFITNIGGETRVEANDILYVCGNAEALKLLEKVQHEKVAHAANP